MEIRKFVAQLDEEPRLTGSTEGKVSKRYKEELMRLKFLREGEVVVGIEINAQEKKVGVSVIQEIFVSVYIHKDESNGDALHGDVTMVLEKRTQKIRDEYLGFFLKRVFSDFSILLAEEFLHGNLIQYSDAPVIDEQGENQSVQ